MYKGNLIPRAVDNLVLWLDASDYSTLSFRDDTDYITEWKDKSGNNNHVIQGTIENQPLYILNVLNNKAVLRFDGIDDKLVKLNATTIDAANVTVFVVAKNDTGSYVNQAFVEYTTIAGTPNKGFLLFKETLAKSRIANDGLNDATKSISEGTYYVFTGYTDVSTVNIRTNGSAGTPANITISPLSPDNLYVGILANNAYPLDGDIAEIIIYNRTLSNTDILQLESYLTTKWGIS